MIFQCQQLVGQGQPLMGLPLMEFGQPMELLHQLLRELLYQLLRELLRELLRLLLGEA
jgi:hypothetical protein